MHFDTPFRGSRAIQAGHVTRHQLAHNFERLHRDVYIRKNVAADAVMRAKAAHVFSRGGAVSCGLSAAALHGAKWIDPDEPAELIWRGRSRQLPGLRIRFDTVPAAETVVVDGVVATSVPRTMVDLARSMPRGKALQILDSLARATGVSAKDALSSVQRSVGLRGVTAARRVLELVDPGAESPQETKTRLLLIDAGLPRPTTQIRVTDASGRVFARCDMGWPEWKVVVEYDGIQHWTSEKQRTWDIERLDKLEKEGWLVVRVNSEQLRNRPGEVVERVRRKLRAAGASV